MKILLTGANGFIGQYFLNHYSNKYEINKFSFLKDDFEYLDTRGCDVVVHLSALVHQKNKVDEDMYENINVSQTLQLAKKAKKEGVRHFVFMSSVKVYGESQKKPYFEDTLCVPQDEYGISKLKAENELKKLESEKFKISVVRTPIVYGCGVKANMKSLIELIRKISILPFANINNKRSFVYIGNLCHMIDEIIQQQKSGIFLASDDESISTTKLIKKIAKELNKNVILINIPFFAIILKKIKPQLYQKLYESLYINNSKTKKELNLKNPFSFEEGIKIMLKHKEENE